MRKNTGRRTWMVGDGDRLWGGGVRGLSWGPKIWENTRIPHISNPPHSQGDLGGEKEFLDGK